MTAPSAAWRAHPILATRRLRALDLADAGATVHLSAASGLVVAGTCRYVIADDEHHLGVFDRDRAEPGRWVRLFDGELPAKHRDRKRAKPDLEALLVLPPALDRPHGALWAIGSGSRPTRRRGAIVALDAVGALAGDAREIDLTPLHAAVEQALGETPNIEGAFIVGNRLCLLQRGGVRASNACLAWDWPEVAAWLERGGDFAACRSVVRHDLGAIDGVPLGYTDGAAAPDGGWLYCAAAEATDNAYDDGGCLGSVIGRVDVTGRHVWQSRVEPICKVEGIALAVGDEGGLEVLLVSDADDRKAPAQLLAATLSAAALSAAA